MNKRSFALLCLLAACGDKGDGRKPPTPAPSRVEAIAADTNQPTESDLCDVLKAPENAPTFAFPTLDGAAPPQPSGYRWINVWATWCPPCVEELPLISKWRDQLNQAGTRVELLLMSVDQTAEAVAKFQAKHPEASSSLRASDPAQLEAWLKSIGLDAGAPLPIHVFVDPQGKVRCARTGALRESDFGLVKKLLAGS